MLDGLLVDLVPWGARFQKLEHKWDNGPAQFWASAGDRSIVTRAALERWQQEHRERMENRPRHGVRFGIQTKDGLPIGSISARAVPHHRLAMLGAAIGEPDYWGGGYGTDALLLVLDYVFDWLDLHKVWLGTMSINARVLRQMEKVGFTLEARSRQHWFADGAWADDMVFGLLRDEWPGRAATIERLGLRVR
ncbi:MAG: GNAT family N-acetyltransferase [Chloroflexi bacterium]|nr:GNAT family N-acetyltransferase [Chloroflexota bacterium]